MTIAKVLAVYKTSPIVLVVESAEGTVLELPSRTCTGRAIDLVTGRGRASYKSIRCLPARLRQASTVQTAAIGLALTPVDGVPIGAEAVALRHVVLWEEAIPGLDMTSCLTARS